MTDPYLTFDELPVVAATIGISALRWTACPEETPLEQIAARMATDRFDTLPLIDEDGKCTGLAVTSTWGQFETATRKELDDVPTLAERTPFQDVVRNFRSDATPYWLLVDEEGRVTGLLSFQHINCREARVWLFHRIAALELALESVVRDALGSGRVALNQLVRTVKESVVGTWYKERLDNDDNWLTSYCYLADLLSTLHKFDLYETSGLWKGSKERSSKPLSRLNERRNQAAHPVRPLVTSPESVVKLDEDLETLDTSLRALHSRGFVG